ncbi:SPOR domain-containing protein [Rhizobium sp. Root1212]|uniref:SPOR domain-containing protein n=1 Tax=unclassified Rhizobium TaxID=2613769 RepID=UPI0032982ADC
MARSGTTDIDLFSDDDPLSELARIVGYDNRPAVQQLQELERHRNAVRQEPVLDLEDELLREFESYAPGAEPQAAAPVAEQPVAEPVFRDEPVFVESHPEEIASAPEEIVAEEPVYSAPEQDEPVFEAFDLDLERELELSIGYAEEPVSVQVPVERPVEPAFVEVPVAEVVAPQRVSEPARGAEPAVVGVSGGDLVDDLLADIERFPVPEKAAVAPAAVASVAAAVPVRKNAYPFTPTFSRATPVASNSAAGQKAFAKPIVATPVVQSAPPEQVAPATQVAPAVKAEPVAQVEPVVLAASVAQAMPADPLLDAIEPVKPAQTAVLPQEPVAEPVVVAAAASLVEPADPEFDLDGFELDLSDIDLDLDPVEVQALERGERVAPVVAQPVFAEKPVEKPVFVEPVYVPKMEEPRVEAPPLANDFTTDADQSDAELPFDPAMIAEAEESLMAIADLDVPQLPVVEQEKPAVHHQDFDLDIDAEMAQLFGTPARPARAASDHAHEDPMFAVAAQSVAAGKAAASRVEDDFDAFERAMEEDFRQSLKPRQEADPASDHLAVGSGYAAEDDFQEERRGGVRRLALLAATVAGLAIVGGAGVYAWMGGSAPGFSGGDPKIILADKTPVKIVPVEKGGKTVPNQDKAVYDRVAGAGAETPQQGTLVSSTEEPIDVVQRTLTPETLPLEGRGDEALPGIMPEDDEGADRLTPDDGQATANAGPQDDSTPAVSPRKVRTMIVKPDGTLVAREEPVEAESQVASVDPVVKPVKTTSIKPTAEAKPAQSALAEAAAVKVEETAPVRPVATTSVNENATVPQAKPVVAEPAASAEQTATTPATEKPAPVQTASVAPGSYVIQIASLPSEAEAQTSYNKLSGKFGSVIGGRGVDIKKAEIAGKGTYYRVRIPAGSKDDANALCSRYKSAGGSCLVTR